MIESNDYFTNNEHTDVDSVTYCVMPQDIENIKFARSLLQEEDIVFSIRIYFMGEVTVKASDEEFKLDGCYIDVYQTNQYIAVYEKYTQELITIPFDLDI